jgi:hypothetical protein
MDKLSRRQSMALGAIGLSAVAIPGSASAAVGNVPGTKLYEHTFLKAKEGLRAQLGLFISANWFPMDQKGLEQGIFTSYWLLEETGNNAAWDYVMVVGYPQDQGYGDQRTAEAFQAIRKAHVEVKIDGKGMRELGDFVGNHRLKIVAA